MRALILGLAASLTFASAANAATIINGGFETGTANPGGGFVTVAGGPSTTTINGWKVGGGSVDYIGGYWQAQEGARSIDLAGSALGSIEQAIATIIGQGYTVTYWVARNPDGGITPRTGFVDVGGAQTLITFGNGASTKANMLWEQRSYNFVATGTTTNLRFSADPATSNSAFGLALDNVSIAAVPEPATWVMMILGFGMVGGAMRRRKSSLAFA